MLLPCPKCHQLTIPYSLKLGAVSNENLTVFQDLTEGPADGVISLSWAVECSSCRAVWQRDNLRIYVYLGIVVGLILNIFIYVFRELIPLWLTVMVVLPFCTGIVAWLYGNIEVSLHPASGNYVVLRNRFKYFSTKIILGFIIFVAVIYFLV